MLTSLIASVLRPIFRYWGRRAAPETHGAILVPDLGEKVKVYWDSFAVPHIFADSEHDLFMAQGYLHAQERLWQMDISRRFLNGRMTEIFGERPLPWKELSIRFLNKTTVHLDYFMRLMGIRRTASASLNVVPQEYVDLLEAYSDGINCYIETHLNSLPLEFRLLRYEPEPWTSVDSLTIAKGFAFFLSTSLFTRLAWTAITGKLKGQEAKLQSLSPSYLTGAPWITRAVAEKAQGLFRFLNGTFQQSDWAIGAQGSNNWVIAPWRSSTGKAILCNDPHLRMTIPSIWYLIHLKASSNNKEKNDFEVWGASIPGSPCVHLGHNRWIAWGVTAALCDDGELYREKIHPREPDLYLAGSQWTKMECTDEKIRIRGGKEVRKEIRATRHGPVISDFAEKDSDDEVLAFKWTAHDPGEEIRALYGVNRARNWDEFLCGLSYQVAPTLNYVYADTEGNIGYSLAGKVPIRPHAPSFLPVPGWNGEFDWKGYVPFNELPRLYNPPEGIIATANNRITDDSYPYYLSDLFEPPYRIRRIKELLAAKQKYSVEEIAEIQRDVVSVQARDMIRDLRDDLEESARKEPSLKKAVEKLTLWDGNCSEESAVAALAHVLHQHIMENLLLPVLGKELFVAYKEIFNQCLVPIEQILRDPQSPWFDSLPRQALVEKSLREACEELTRRLGADMDQWRWGRIHTLTLQHHLGRSKILAPFFSIGPLPSPGDSVTINMGFYRHSDPYQHIVGPSLRMLINVGDWRLSRFILPSGQSGHFFSPHYGDQTELWRRGNYIQLCCGEEEIKNWPLLILTPEAE
jgi:penicillin amidase